MYSREERTWLTGKINYRTLLPKIVTREELQGAFIICQDLRKKGGVRLLEHVR